MKNLFLLLFIFKCSIVFGNDALKLKNQILQISKQNLERLDNLTEIRKELNPLVKKLSKLQNLNPDQSKKLKVGVWKQLWTDDADDLRANNIFQKVQRDQTYQVVFSDGIFYNLTVLKTPVGEFSGFLRGEYIQNDKFPNYLDLSFTDLKLKRGGLSRLSRDLLDKTLEVEKGVSKTFRLPFGLDQYPNGPVGAKGVINTVYIDNFLRIDIGRNNADNTEDLFILIKIH